MWRMYILDSLYRIYIYRVAQKEHNTYDHYFQRNQGLNQIIECINA